MKLDLGCGMNKRAGFTGLDRLAMPGVDIVCDLDREPIPLGDGVVEEVFTMHFLEHTADLLFVMEEVWRVCRDGARVSIAVPYFNSIGAFRDPTHRRFFTYETFDHFTGSARVPSFYSAARFGIVRKRILFRPANSNWKGRLRLAHMWPLQWLADLSPYFYEHSLFRGFAASDLQVELVVIKPGQAPGHRTTST